MATNDITGDKLISKVTTDAYRDNYDLIFGKLASNSDTPSTDDHGITTDKNEGAINEK